LERHLFHNPYIGPEVMFALRSKADGRPLGLRPLGFQLALEDAQETSAVLSLPGGRAPVTPTRSAGARGVRLGRPRLDYNGAAEALHVSVTDAAGEHHLVLTAGEAARDGQLEVGLERYFPDFALGANNEPFSRSDEPRNPAALLTVRKGEQAYRVFVLASVPGIHKVEALDASFALTAVDPQRSVALRVSVAPAAPWALVGLVFASLGLALQARVVPAPRSVAASGSAPGALLCGALLTLGGGDVLRWSWTSGLDTAATVWPGPGLTLGVALLAALGGTLLIAVPVVASGAAAPALPLVLGRRAQILGATTAGIGAVLLVTEAGPHFETGYEATLVALAAGALALSLVSSDPRPLPRAAAAAVVLLLAAVGVGSWLRWGGYDTRAVEAVASIALLALALSE